MARQRGNNFILGTIDHIVYYQLNGVYYLRAKSTLDRKRFQEDPAFTRSRAKAVQFGDAVRVAKDIYYSLPKQVRQRGFMGILTGQVHQKLLAGKSRETVRHEMLALYGAELVNIEKEKEEKCSCLASFIIKAREVLVHKMEVSANNKVLKSLSNTDKTSLFHNDRAFLGPT